MQVDYYAPHTAPGRDTRCSAAPTPEAQDEHLYDSAPLPQPPSFNQADVSEMPSFIRDKPLLTDEQIDRITQHYRCALESIHGVDRGIGEIYDAVAAAGELNDTVFLFTSDNGYFYGEHRIDKGKPYPYAENINMPLTISVPPRYRDTAPLLTDSDAPVANIDLAPTLLELAHGKPCRRQGQVPGDGRPLADARDRGHRRVPERPGNRPRALQTATSAGSATGPASTSPTRSRTRRDASPTRPRCTTSAPTPSSSTICCRRPTARRTTSSALMLTNKMRKLSDCAGIRGRDERPPSGHFCE